MHSPSDSALDTLAARIGNENLQRDADSRDRAASSWSPLATKSRQNNLASPFAAVATPTDTDTVATVVAWANEKGVRLLPVGGGSNTVGSTSPSSPASGDRFCVAVDLRLLKAIDWDEESLLVTVGAGWTIGDLERTLNAHDYTLGQFPQSFDLLAVGGAIATDAVGALAGKYGRFSDITLGLTAILPGGEVVRTRRSPLGSAVADLHGLFVGAEGQFGVVTEATLRMRPSPEARAWAAFAFASFAEGVDALRLVHRSDARPSGVRLLDRAAAGPLADIAGIGPRGALLLLAFEGDEIVQTGHFQLAYAVCQQTGGTPIADADLGERWFADWREKPGAAFAANGRAGAVADIFRLSAPYAALKTVRASVQKAIAPLVTAQSAQVGCADEVGASLEIGFEAQAATDSEAVPLYHRILGAGLDACLAAGGAVAHAGGVGQTHASALARERGGAVSATWRSLQKTLDPNRIFSDEKDESDPDA